MVFRSHTKKRAIGFEATMKNGGREGGRSITEDHIQTLDGSPMEGM